MAGGTGTSLGPGWHTCGTSECCCNQQRVRTSLPSSPSLACFKFFHQKGCESCESSCDLLEVTSGAPMQMEVSVGDPSAVGAPIRAAAVVVVVVGTFLKLLNCERSNPMGLDCATHRCQASPAHASKHTLSINLNQASNFGSHRLTLHRRKHGQRNSSCRRNIRCQRPQWHGDLPQQPPPVELEGAWAGTGRVQPQSSAPEVLQGGSPRRQPSSPTSVVANLKPVHGARGPRDASSMQVVRWQAPETS